MTGSGLGAIGSARMRAAYAAGELSPVEVVRDVIARAHEVQPVLNCFVEILDDRALADARASEARWRAGAPLGPADGVPSTVKEIVPAAGAPMTWATEALDGIAEVPTEDGPPLARAREAGSVVVARTTMPELAMLSSGVSTLHGVTRSPLDPAWSVGGSSAGAAAAAAAGCGPMHGGSDIGGSLRYPAAWTGTATLKPTWARLPVAPPYMGRTIGSIGRTVDDVALHTSVLAGPDPRDYTALPFEPLDWLTPREPDLPRLRVALLLDAGCGMAADPEVLAVVEAAAARFERAGAAVEPIAPFTTPAMLDALDRFFRIRSFVDTRSLAPERRERILTFIRAWMAPAADFSGEEVMRAYELVQAMRRAAVEATLPYDLVLSPVAPVATFPAAWPMPSNDPERAMDHLGYAAAYNFSEQPAGCLNAGFTADGRPVGLQIAGRRFDDLGVLDAMRWFERERPASAVVDWARIDAGPIGPVDAAAERESAAER